MVGDLVSFGWLVQPRWPKISVARLSVLYVV